ncbi:MAG: ankyrin repeat domain-containing protein [Thermodesulfobacteriota bacterium]
MHKIQIVGVVTAFVAALIMSCFAADEDQTEALLKAALQNDVKQLQELLDKGVDVNAIGRHGWTALIIAACTRRTQELNARDNEGKPVRITWGNREPGVIRVLVDRGADVNAADNEGWTALMEAVPDRDAETVKMLLDGGADVNAKNKDGLTALAIAVHRKHGPEVAELFLERGADVNAKDKDGRTALMTVLSPRFQRPTDSAPPSGSLDGAERRTAGIDMKATYGSPALREDDAARCKSLVQLLFSKGADVSAMDNAGRTALSMFREPFIEIEGDILEDTQGDRGSDLSVNIKNGTVRVKTTPPPELVELLTPREAKK